MNSKNASQLVQQLATICNQFGTEVAAEKLRLIQSIGFFKLTSIKQIKLLHDCLLFLMAYAENEQLNTQATMAMESLCRMIQLFSAEKKEHFTNSGVAFNETQGTFSFVLMKWLIQNWPDEITVHSFDETGEHPRELLKHGLNEIEFELIGDSDLSKIKWLEKTSGSKNKKDILKFLIDRVDEMPLAVALKEQ